MPAPKYPVYFLENGEKGQVILGVRTLNNLSNMVRIIESSGYHRLDNAALQPLKNILIYPKIRKDIEYYRLVKCSFESFFRRPPCLKQSILSKLPCPETSKTVKMRGCLSRYYFLCKPMLT
ncbi:energy transducer TonB [Neisseria sicca]|uniref:energy transducer TonB n=1 Tax=Neisseria sicca TaxID=490 RepID=UPI001145BAAE